MSDLLDAVKLPDNQRKTVCEFLLVFSRFEFALKKARYLHKPRASAIGVDRKKFADDVNVSLQEKLKTPEQRERLDPLLNRPPMEQVIDEHGNLKWKKIPPGSDAKSLLDSAYRVRNNLFHGGKWPPEPARDEELLRSVLALIEICLQVHKDVAEAYFSMT